MAQSWALCAWPQALPLEPLPGPLKPALVWPQLLSVHIDHGEAGAGHLAGGKSVGMFAHSRMLQLQIYLRGGSARRSAQHR